MIAPIKVPEEPAEYYNSHLTDPKPSYYLSKLYTTVIDLLPKNKNRRIIDLGCGRGTFAQALYKKGYRHYMGIDFADKVIDLAKKAVPKYEFLVADLYDAKTHELYPLYNIFILIESLEHIERDMDVLKSIPKGKWLIFSVPNTNQVGHVRTYNSMRYTVLRYKDLMDFDGVEVVHAANGKRYIVGWGKRI